MRMAGISAQPTELRFEEIALHSMVEEAENAEAQQGLMEVVQVTDHTDHTGEGDAVDDTYCILMQKRQWERWVATSHRFGFKDLMNSQDENSTFIELLLDIAEASPIETRGEGESMVTTVIPRGVSLAVEEAVGGGTPGRRKRGRPPGARNLKETTPLGESSEDEESAGTDDTEPEVKLEPEDEDAAGVNDPSDPDFDPRHSTLAARSSRRVRRLKKRYDENEWEVARPKSTYREISVVEVNPDNDEQSKYLCTVCRADDDTCVAEFSTREELSQHHEAAHPGVVETYVVVGSSGVATRSGRRRQQSPRARAMMAHLKKRRRGRPPLGEKSFACDICNEVFKRRIELENHVDLVHLDTEYPCHVCGKLYKSRQRVYHHVRTSHMKKPTGSKPRFACTSCGKTFKGQSALKAHIHSIHIGTRYECEFCGMLFTTKFVLRTHVAQKHKQTDQYICYECGQIYYHPHSLKKHISASHGTEQLQCGQCGKVFPNEKKLRMHEVTHSDVRNFPCSLCSRKFKWMSHLKRHERYVHKLPRQNDNSAAAALINAPLQEIRNVQESEVATNVTVATVIQS